MSDLDKSAIKKFLFNMALSSKESELNRSVHVKVYLNFSQLLMV